MGTDQYLLLRNRKTTSSFILTILAALALDVSCKSVIERQDVRPRILRDVPAQNLAYRFEPDVSPPSDLKLDDSSDKFAADSGAVGTTHGPTPAKRAGVIRVIQP